MRLMRLKKGLVWIVALLTLSLVLVGCSQNQQSIFQAALNLQDVNSMHSHTTMTVNLSGSGLDPAVQQQVDMAAAFLNNAKLDWDLKYNGNEDKTISKTKLDLDLASPGQDFDLLCWVDMNLAADKPQLTETVKLPEIAKATLPAQYADKQFMVLNPLEDSAQGTIDTAKLMTFSKDFSKAEIAFLKSYSQRFNPSIDVEKVGTKSVQFNGSTKNADIYELKLNDAQFKELIRYTVNNFAQDSEAMDFAKQYIDAVLGLAQVPDKEKTISDFDQAFQQFNQNKDQFLTNFNNAMDQLNNVSLLGPKGIDVKYVIANGYCVEKSGTIDLHLDLAEIAQLLKTLDPQSAAEGTQGSLNLQLQFNTDVSAINAPLSIDTPKANSDNSFSYQDFIKNLPVQQ